MTKNILKVILDDVVIQEDNSAATYRKVFDLLYEKNLITDNVILDFPGVIKKGESAWRKTALNKPHVLTEITNTTNLILYTGSSAVQKQRVLQSIFHKYKINGTVELLDTANNLLPIQQLKPYKRHNFNTASPSFEKTIVQPSIEPRTNGITKESHIHTVKNPYA